MLNPFVTHTCRRKDCQWAFHAEDTNNAQFYPPTNKFCPVCIAAGFQNVRDARGKNGAENLKKFREREQHKTA